jgi:methionyl-tRNA synthetase
LKPKEEKKMTDSTIIPPAPDTTPEPVVSNVIQFADFEKVDIRAGTILSAEIVPKSELLKLEVSFGPLGNRTILARIATSFTPEAVTGRQIVAVLNLEPRKMKGVMSNGMLLASERSDGVLALVSLSAVVPDGAQVG